MAEKKATLLIELKDLVTGPIKGLVSVIGNLKLAWLAVIPAIRQVIEFFKESLNLALEEEKAIAKLNQALKNQGIFTDQTSRSLQEFANQLQRNLGISNSLVLETEALLTAYGLTGDKLKEVTKAALDLSAGFGIDLRTATVALGKAYQGNTALLERQVGKINEAIPASQKFSAGMDILNSKFGGSAQAQAETFSGKIKIMKERFQDLQKDIGKDLIPKLEKLVTVMNVLLSVLEFVGEKTRKLKQVNDDLFSVFTTMTKAVIDQTIRQTDLGKAILDKIGISSLEEDHLNFKHEQEKKRQDEKLAKAKEMALEKAKIDEELLEKEIEFANKSIQESNKKLGIIIGNTKDFQIKQLINLGKFNEAQELADALHHANELKTLGESNLAKELEQKARAKADVIIAEERAEAIQDVLTRLSTFETSRMRTLASIGKAASIAISTMDTYEAANKALKAGGGWPFGVIMAAATIAAGLANVARIKGTPLAHGGMVLPTGAGTLANIAEAGRAEAVIPLDDSRTKEKLRDTLGGRQLTININAGTVIADKFSVTEFAQMIDRELFKLNRNRKSVAF